MAVDAASAASIEQWEPAWTRTFDPHTDGFTLPPAMAVATDGAGSAYVSGMVETPDGWTAMVLSKFDPNGTLRWRRTWRATSGLHRHTLGHDVAVSPDGRTVYVGGAQLNDSGEDAIARMWAYTSAGSLRWTRADWAGSATYTAVSARTNGVVAGGRSVGECGPVNGFIAAFATDGERRWRDAFEPGAREAYGDAVTGIAIDLHGRIVVVGSQNRSATACDSGAPTSDRDVVIQQRTSLGGILWTRIVSDPGVRDFDAALSVDTVGSLIVAAGRRDAWIERPGRAWLACLTADGRFRWTRRWGTETPKGSSANGVAVAPWRSVYVVSKVGGTMSLRRYSLTGALGSERRRGRPSPSDVAAGLGGTLYVTGGALLWRMRP